MGVTFFTSYVYLCIPFSYLALLFAILPTLAFFSIRRRRKLARIGHCPKCGYNLHAHPPGARCPECGTPVAQKTNARPPNHRRHERDFPFQAPPPPVYNPRMIQFNVEQTPSQWPAILQHVEAGETVQLLRGDRLVAVVHSPDDLDGWAALSTKQLAATLAPEDFSDWNPPHATR